MVLYDYYMIIYDYYTIIIYYFIWLLFYMIIIWFLLLYYMVLLGTDDKIIFSSVIESSVTDLEVENKNMIVTYMIDSC